MVRKPASRAYYYDKATRPSVGWVAPGGTQGLMGAWDNDD
jgi:hypothetical protein